MNNGIFLELPRNVNFYLKKYGFQAPVISEKPAANLGICVVIPCHNEPDLISTLEALAACEPTTCAVEVIIIINAGVQSSLAAKMQNKATQVVAQEWIKTLNKSALQFHIIFENELPKKHAGVGLARKIGMDEAVSRFEQINHDGIIVCFDADATCTSNYLTTIEQHFNQNLNTPGCSIHYEHPISGYKFDAEIYKGIINYELHLRYYNQGLRFANLPYAYHTVGSSMAVRSSAYQKQGGMNKRKAGEDFYFIHKIIALGNFTEITKAMVIPSPRISDRVPFGTGKAIGDWIETKKDIYETYAFESFKIVQAFVACHLNFQEGDLNLNNIALSEKHKTLLIEFLMLNDAEAAMQEIARNSKTTAAFSKRFFRWFDAFKVLKLMHFLRDNGLNTNPVFEETKKLITALSLDNTQSDVTQQLSFLRAYEKK